jgi:hypothetical protein
MAVVLPTPLLVISYTETTLQWFAPTCTPRVRPLHRRPRHPQNAGRLDLRLAGGEHPPSLNEPRTHERLGTPDVRPALLSGFHAGDGAFFDDLPLELCDGAQDLI